ncbi:hypothetical protein [Nonomuraea sp. NPDC049129]|uniref:hypothetical protein n=1 Tax=Nonomuraea sp. NPDC049129 TaxID=3155272 RepID=UPI0033E32754
MSFDASPIDWDDPRSAYRKSRSLLTRLGNSPDTLGALVRGIGENETLLADCDRHPVMDRLTLYRDDARGIYLRLHVSQGMNEIMPHDHKYGFTTMILRGSYTHVWRRRTGALNGEFTSAEIEPGLVTVERPGSCYCLQHTQVHQTIMERDTVTLFLRGPRRQERSYAAVDMLQTYMETYAAQAPEEIRDGVFNGSHTFQSHTEMNRRMSFEEYFGLSARLTAMGVIR